MYRDTTMMCEQKTRLHGLHGSGQAVDVMELGEGLGRRGRGGLRLYLPLQSLGVPLGTFSPLMGPLLLRVQLVPGRRLGHLLLLLLLLVRLRAARARARTPTEPKLMGQLGRFDHSAARPVCAYVQYGTLNRTTCAYTATTGPCAATLRRLLVFLSCPDGYRARLLHA